MSFYDDMRSVVGEIMIEFEQGTITFIKVTPASGPVDNPGTPTEVVHPLDATTNGVSFEFVRDGLAVVSDIMVTATPVDDVVVSEKDYITIDGVRYKIVHDASKPIAGTKAVWKFIVRKGG